MPSHQRQWRFYETRAGNKPVRVFLDDLPAADAAEIVAAMKHVAREGLQAARHLRGDIWEVRVDGGDLPRLVVAARLVGRYRISYSIDANSEMGGERWTTWKSTWLNAKGVSLASNSS